jgi:hypothetical protein
MGHSSITVTVDIYKHWIPSANRDAVNRLPLWVLRRLPKPQPAIRSTVHETAMLYYRVPSKRTYDQLRPDHLLVASVPNRSILRRNSQVPLVSRTVDSTTNGLLDPGVHL